MRLLNCDYSDIECEYLKLSKIKQGTCKRKYGNMYNLNGF